MALIVVKENQTVRGVKMSEQLTNIIKILFVTFILLFAWSEAFGKTITMEVDGKEIITITVSDDTVTGEQEAEPTEEEPDCE